MKTRYLLAVLGGFGIFLIGPVTAKSQIDNPVDEVPECPEAFSFMPHQNCSRYWRCDNFVPLLFECQPGLYFDPATSYCNFPANVPECVGGTRPPPLTTTLFTTSITESSTSANTSTTVEDKPECPEPYALIEHQDCTKYWACNNYVPILRECISWLYFNPRLGGCDYPSNVPECVGGTRPPTTATTSVSTFTTELVTSTEVFSTPIPTSTEAFSTTSIENSTPPTPTEKISTTEGTIVTTGETTIQISTTDNPVSTTEAFCPPSGVHDFPYPGNCSLYIRCIQGNPIVLSCTPTFLFDKNDRICKPEEEAECDEEIPNKCPIDGSYDSFPHESSCSLYNFCFGGELFTAECVANAYYDETLKGCTHAHEAICHSECPKIGIVFLPIRARPCQWYKRCSNGISKNYDCGIDQSYHPMQEQCVNSWEYTCPYSFHNLI